MRLKRPTPAQIGLTEDEGAFLRAFRTPEDIQQFVIGLNANFEEGGDTLRSVRGVLKHRKAHCIEAAFTAACALWLQGEPPLVMDFFAKGDADHVIALFKRDGCWGAISKSRGEGLSYRDPVYRSLRELAMSWFHEYLDERARRTLREYSVAFDMRDLAPELWVTSTSACDEAQDRLGRLRRFPLITRRSEKTVMSSLR